MRARIKPRALSDHAALAALTAVERGRLEHIARSIPPEHSTETRSESRARGLRGRQLLRRWVTVVAAVEGLGFMAPAVVGATTTSAAEYVAVPALVAAGLVEGTVLGIGQAFVFRRAIPDISMPTWVLATAVGAMLAYTIAILPPSLVETSDWPAPATIAGAPVLGVLTLLTIGGMQWLVLRQHLHGAYRWVLVTAVAWFAGMAAFLGFSTPLWQEGQARSTTIAVGVVGGLLMAGVTAWVTGVGLVRLLASDDRINGG